MKKALLIPALLLALTSAISLNAQTTGSETPSFQEFLQQFPSATLPYSFNSADLQRQLENQNAKAPRAKRLAWDFYQFLPELERSAQYSNMPVYPEPVASFETEEYFAVLYNIARGASKGTKTYSLTVFDKQGNYIGTNFVAGLNSKVITTAIIDAKMQAVVTEFTVNWANSFLDNGLEGNHVTNLTVKNQQKVNLTTPGNPDQLQWTAAPTTISDTTVATADRK